ncbi:uncharacterized protein [Chironomus tepperi]|uniref:uncharacterized protein n=1 Tax=Chironomus tepperi TaxID=113505 RepID=UPI00391FB123
MEQANLVKLLINNSSNVYEINFDWNIPKYQLNTIYSENLKLRDDLECTIMLVPKKCYGRTIKNFVRSQSTILFTKVPDDGRETWFSYSIRTITNFPLACAGFRRIEMSSEAYVGNRNNLSTASYKQLLDKNSSLNLNVKFYLDDIGCSSFSIDHFGEGHTLLSPYFSYDDIMYPDITLISADNNKFPANKAVLAARSSVFAKVLAEDIDTYVIEGGFSKDDIMAFLQFLYTDTISVDKLDDSAINLMELASKYEVSELVNLCQQYIFKECKTQIADISMKMKKLSSEDIFALDNFNEFNRCVKNLYRCTKDINAIK